MILYIIIVIYSIITDDAGEEPLVWRGKMKSRMQQRLLTYCIAAY